MPPPAEIPADVLALGVLIAALVVLLAGAAGLPLGGALDGCDRHDDEDPMGEAEERDLRNKHWEGKEEE